MTNLLYPKTWTEVAHLVNDYMRLPCGRVVYEEATEQRIVFVPPTLGESIYDLLHLRMPRMRKELVPGQKFAVIKVLDEDGKNLVHATLEQDALYTFDKSRIKSLGCMLQRAVKEKTDA